MTGSIFPTLPEARISILALLVICTDKGVSSSLICFPLKNIGPEVCKLSNKVFSYTLSFSSKFTLRSVKLSP